MHQIEPGVERIPVDGVHCLPMNMEKLSIDQLHVVGSAIGGGIFLEGPAGTGKTTTGVARTLHLLSNGVSADSVLIIIPQRMLANPYYEALRRSSLAAGGQVLIFTIAGLARRMVELFWPLIAEEAGFINPDAQPKFLTLETAQYYMARVIQPLLDNRGYFEGISITRNRLYSQILDNLNKAAVVGFHHHEIGERLKGAWSGDPTLLFMYDQAQECAILFREECLKHNLLDFSLQLLVFRDYLWSMPVFQEYLADRYRHLIVDNIEEDTPVAHDLLTSWIPRLESTLLIYDRFGGFRRFLGADPQNAYSLRKLCDEHVVFNRSFITSKEMQAFSFQLAQKLDQPMDPVEGDVSPALQFEYHHYQPQMLAWIADQVAELTEERNVPANEIVILAPFMTDALRFSLMDLLTRKGVPSRSHRPSRALYEEPATRCLLTLISLAHPEWGMVPPNVDVANALTMAIEDLDLVRSHLIARVLYRIREGIPHLEPFKQVLPEMQERITYVIGERYERLRKWIEDYRQGLEMELDHFIGRIFGEVLSQREYGFHKDFDSGVVVANLIESVQKFRWVVGDEIASSGESCGREYLRLVQEGLVASQYLRSWEVQPVDAVLLAPAYTFLMANRPVEFQFWLDIGSSGWWERLYQPLTHPYVLSRRWQKGAKWTDDHEHSTMQVTLHTLTQGLIRRCKKKIYLGMSELGDGGNEQRGPLLKALQRLLLDLSSGVE